MEGTYEVTYGGQTVGTADVTREGLYCRICARCRVSGRQIHRLYADGEKVGVLIPEGEWLILDTRIPAKRWKIAPAFSLDADRGACIPICPGERFPKLDMLRRGKLVHRNGEPCLFLEL